MTGKRAFALAVLAATFAAATTWGVRAGREKGTTSPTKLRRPVAAAWLGRGDLPAVANRCGSISLVDPRSGELREETIVGERLADLAALPDGKQLCAVDENKNELVTLTFDAGRLTVQARLKVGPYPVSVAVTADGRRASVASLWSRRVEVVDLAPFSTADKSAPLRILHSISLPFAPRLQLMLPGCNRVAVADAFGGHLAVIDVTSGRLVAVHEMEGHNLHGLALSADGKDLLLTHQILNQRAATTRENVERGVLMANVLHVLPLDKLGTAGVDLNQCGRIIRLGSQGAGAGDPAGVAVLDGGRLAVALAGVNEVALIGHNGATTRRIPVGKRPTVLLTAPGRPLVAVNTNDDSLSLLDPDKGNVLRTVSLGPQPPLGPRERGELLFFDARLARDGWMSCHSCHSDGHTNGLLADTLGDGTYGTPKRTLTLRGTALTDPWGWNGGFKYLQDQIEKSLVDTMSAPSVAPGTIEDLMSFLHALPVPPPLEPEPPSGPEREQVERGRRLFEVKGCIHCHIPPLTYSSHEVHDVGFVDERGLRRFNPPSLRGVGQGYRFLHDNRAATLEEVFTKQHHKVGTDFPAADLADLLRFLRSL
jgi:DNA-binding beta-propeller fold protein YncE